MRQLTSLDTRFLALETPRQYGHVGGLGEALEELRPHDRAGAHGA